MFRLILLVLLLVPAWSLAQESQETKEPSLAELARMERERRAQMKAVPILTNADLRKARGLVSTSAEAETETAEGAEEGESEPEETPESAEPDPSVWRGRFSEARLNLKNAVNRNLVLQLKMNDLRNTYLSEDNGVTQARIQQQLLETQQDIESNQQSIQAARQAIDALQGEAQKEGIPASTVSGLVGELPEDTSIITSPQ